MLSITGAVIARDERDTFLERLDLASWPFFSDGWSSVHELVVPALTVRERLFLERAVMSKAPAELISELGFESAADIPIDEFLESYKNYYRFYPTLLSAEI
jgi:hypothetical protein